jgi:hypothetical protein
VSSIKDEHVKQSNFDETATPNEVKARTLSSPYSKYKPNDTHAPKFAYAYVISGCNEDGAHRNYLYDIAISRIINAKKVQLLTLLYLSNWGTNLLCWSLLNKINYF